MDDENISGEGREQSPPRAYCVTAHAWAASELEQFEEFGAATAALFEE